MSPKPRSERAPKEAKPDVPLGYRTDRKGGFTPRGDWDAGADWNSPRRKFVQHIVDLRRRTFDPLGPRAIAEIILAPTNREFRGMFHEAALIAWLDRESFDDWHQLLPIPSSELENAATASVRFCGNSGVGQEACVWQRGWYKPARLLRGARDGQATREEGRSIVEAAAASFGIEAEAKPEPPRERKAERPIPGEREFAEYQPNPGGTQ